MGDMKMRSILWMMLLLFGSFLIVSAERKLVKIQLPNFNVTNTLTQKHEQSFLTKAVDFLWKSDGSGYQHVWPEMEFGWQIVLGSFIGFCGAAFGSVGGVGGGGIFVPMLSLIIGFDPKSSTAISKCMIMGAALLIINNDDLMRTICISTWPSLLLSDGIGCRKISRFPGRYRSFFCQTFPPIDEHHPLPPPPPPPRPMTFFMYTMDVFLRGQREPCYSDLTIEQVSTTDSTLESLLGTKLFNSLRSTHFRMDFSSCGDGRKFFHVKIEGCEEYLKQNMRFSFVVVETLRECAGSLFHPSTCKPVSVKKMKIDGTIGAEVVFETFIPAPVGFYTQMVKCEVKITCSWEEGEEDRFYVDIITFTMYDMNGKQVRSRNGNLIISNAIENGERKINK